MNSISTQKKTTKYFTAVDLKLTTCRNMPKRLGFVTVHSCTVLVWMHVFLKSQISRTVMKQTLIVSGFTLQQLSVGKVDNKLIGQ